MTCYDCVHYKVCLAIDILGKIKEDAESCEMLNIIMCYFSENEERGDKRLKRLFDGLSSMMDEYIDFYNFDNDDDALFVCKYKLKEKGVSTAEMRQPFDFEVDMK